MHACNYRRNLFCYDGKRPHGDSFIEGRSPARRSSELPAVLPLSPGSLAPFRRFCDRADALLQLLLLVLRAAVPSNRQWQTELRGRDVRQSRAAYNSRDHVVWQGTNARPQSTARRSVS